MGGEKVDRDEYAQVLEKDLAIPYFIGMGMIKLTSVGIRDNVKLCL